MHFTIRFQHIYTFHVKAFMNKSTRFVFIFMSIIYEYICTWNPSINPFEYNYITVIHYKHSRCIQAHRHKIRVHHLHCSTNNVISNQTFSTHTRARAHEHIQRQSYSLTTCKMRLIFRFHENCWIRIHLALCNELTVCHEIYQKFLSISDDVQEEKDVGCHSEISNRHIFAQKLCQNLFINLIGCGKEYFQIWATYWTTKRDWIYEVQFEQQRVGQISKISIKQPLSRIITWMLLIKMHSIDHH